MEEFSKDNNLRFDPVKDFVNLDSQTLESILMEMMRKDKHLRTKTQVNRPQKLSVLMLYQKLCEKVNMSESSNILEVFEDFYLTYMVSHKRKSREELFETLSSMFRKSSESLSISAAFKEKWED
ncbi:MAG: hypothetical protein GF317_17625 [Candidatus Lokiarchaeota archaeon]|nr:hypothetical protein [Candidatus Lokiarchaeota archaeon]